MKQPTILCRPTVHRLKQFFLYVYASIFGKLYAAFFVLNKIISLQLQWKFASITTVVQLRVTFEFFITFI